MQSGIVQSHHPAQTHPTMMLMATQGPPGGPQPPMPQTALNPIPVSSTTHFSYLAHPQGMFVFLTFTLLQGGVRQIYSIFSPLQLEDLHDEHVVAPSLAVVYTHVCAHFGI